MSIGYATGRSLIHTGLMRRWKDLVSYSNPPVPPVTNPTIGFTAQGSATTQTGVKKYGTASYLAGGTGGNSNLLNTSGDYAFWPTGTSDYTVEWWMYVPSSVSGNYMEFISNENTGGGFGLRFGQEYGYSNFQSLGFFARGQADMNYYNITWARDTWFYVSATRSSGNIYVHLDGSIVTQSGGSGAGARNYAATTGLNKIEIGNAGGGGLRNIYIDDFRISNIARYGSGSYTPPTAEGILETGTTLLLNMNGSNGGTSFPNKTSN